MIEVEKVVRNCSRRALCPYLFPEAIFLYLFDPVRMITSAFFFFYSPIVMYAETIVIKRSWWALCHPCFLRTFFNILLIL